MRILKYLILLILIVIIGVIVLTRIPAVQDRVTTNVINRILNSQATLPEDALSAVVCGSRSPLPAPGRAEACILVTAGKNLYVIDVGDGSAANLRNWRIDLGNLRATLFTHLHSDHISDLADLQLNAWIAQSRLQKLKVYGPQGVEQVVKGFEEAYSLDYQFRNEHHGDDVAPLEVAGLDPYVIDLSNPVIIDEDGLKVTAFAVVHDPVEPALGYRFDYKGRSIVISGDTVYHENVIKNSMNTDVLFHEAQANHIIKIMEDATRESGNIYISKIMSDITTYHTTPIEAAEVANEANVGHLVFYHLTPAPRNGLMANMFVRGVNEIRKDWTLSEDGTMVILPLNSDEIEITSIK